MSFTGISSPDYGIDKVNALLAEVADEFGTAGRPSACRVTRAWNFVTRVVRRHVSGSALDDALDALPAQIRLLAEPMGAELLARGER